MLCSVWLSLLLRITPTFGDRILGTISTPSYSHQIVFRSLWKELSRRGHQVTILTSDPVKSPLLVNLTEIDLSFSYKIWNEKFDMVEIAKLNSIDFVNHVVKMSSSLVDEQLDHSSVRSLLKNNTGNFDIALIEPLFPAMILFAEKFKCPLIQIHSLDGMSYMYHTVGNPSHPVLNPEYVQSFPEKLNFFERLASTFLSLLMEYYFYPSMLKAHQAVANKYFGKQFSTLDETLERTGVIFVNTNIVFHRIRPLLPNVIQLGGGTHFTTFKPLPKDLQNLLDKARNGFIYFSLGTNVKSKHLPEHTRKVLLETFAELPYTILWKFELEDLPGKPDNIVISKWFPQQDVLRHPNVKLFITQGGLQSIEEAVYNHIPIIGMPFAIDQKANIQKVVEKGVGLSVDYNTIRKESFREAILEAINNSVYRNKIKKLSVLMRDRPLSGLKSAVWWTEYVLRHKEAKHLRSPSLYLPNYYQYYLLDVIAFCVLIILIIGYVFIKAAIFVNGLCKKSVSGYKLKIQ